MGVCGRGEAVATVMRASFREGLGYWGGLFLLGLTEVGEGVRALATLMCVSISNLQVCRGRALRVRGSREASGAGQELPPPNNKTAPAAA